MRLCLVLLQWFFFACFGQKARNIGFMYRDDGCIRGFHCLGWRLCPSMIHMEKKLNARPRSCGRGMVCCPKLENKETCGLEGNIQSATDYSYSDIPDDKYPWMVALMDEENDYLCSGFLVDQRHVITSARCFNKSAEPEKFSARIGSSDYPEGRLFNVTRISIHDDYKYPILKNDIAIFTLSEKVESPYFNPICLPPLTSKSWLDLGAESLRVVGWGPRGLFSLWENVEESLRELEIGVMSRAKCEIMFLENYGSTFLLGEGLDNQGLCTNPLYSFWIDGPLMVKEGERWTAVGIFNGVPEVKTFQNNYPQVYARITDYYFWINNGKLF